MSTFMLSPFQNQPVTQPEFENFKIEVREKFDSVDRRFNEQREYMDDGFEKLNYKIDVVESNMNQRFDRLEMKVDGISDQVNSLTSQTTLLMSQMTLLTKTTTKLMDAVDRIEAKVS